MSEIGIPTFNFGGLASGLDTASIVQQLMAIERRPRIRLEQRVAIEEARQTALKDVQTRLRNLLTKAQSLRDAATWGDVQTVSSGDPTKVDVKRVGGAAAGGYSVQVVALARAAQLTQGSAITQAGGDDTLRISVGTTSPTTVDVEIASADSVQTIADKINGSSGAPVYASVVSGKLVLSGKTTGADATVTVTDGNAGNAYDLAADLGFTQTQAPQNADFWIDSTHYTDGSANVVKDLLPGLEITLKATTGGGAVGLSVAAPTADAAAIQTKVQEFVDQYNSTIEFVRGKLEEEKAANPQTAGELVKGVLRGDAGLTQLLSRLRSAVSDVVSGRPAALDHLADLGVSTGSSTGTVDRAAITGRLVFESPKLTEKLSSSFADVKALLTNVTGSYESEGLAQRFDRLLTPWLVGDGTDGAIITGRIDASRRAVGDLRDSMSELDRRLATKERQLRAQFTAMESALNAAQSQGQWLQGQLAALL
jgi:flagellar hook-associated protein 2